MGCSTLVTTLGPSRPVRTARTARTTPVPTGPGAAPAGSASPRRCRPRRSGRPPLRRALAGTGRGRTASPPPASPRRRGRRPRRAWALHPCARPRRGPGPDTSRSPTTRSSTKYSAGMATTWHATPSGTPHRSAARARRPKSADRDPAPFALAGRHCDPVRPAHGPACPAPRAASPGATPRPVRARGPAARLASTKVTASPTATSPGPHPRGGVVPTASSPPTPG